MTNSHPQRPGAERPTRSLHLVDVENLLGTCVAPSGLVRLLSRQYKYAAGFQPTDLVVVSCSHAAARHVAWSWEGPRLLRLRSGPDGADLALLEEVADIELVRRFDRVCIGSGDGIFAGAAAQIAAAGVAVTVVTRPCALSGRLRLATMDVRYLPVPSVHEPRVA